MHETYGDRVQFLLVYIREAHAIDSESPMTFGMIEDPISDAERRGVASQCVDDLELDAITTVIDRLDDRVNQAYQAGPDRLYLVGQDGKIAYAGARGPSGFRPSELEDAIVAELGRDR